MKAKPKVKKVVKKAVRGVSDSLTITAPGTGATYWTDDATPKIMPLPTDYGREDLNQMAAKINEIIEKL